MSPLVPEHPDSTSPNEPLESCAGASTILTSGESNNEVVAAELVFDVSSASETIKFLGFVTGVDKPRNELAGLFDWTCAACTFHNRNTAMIRPEQAFLARWVCTSCGRVTLVRFRSRGNPEWVVQHTLAVAGATLGATEDPTAPPQGRGRRAKLRRSGGQQLFAFVAIPALALIIFLGLSDLYPVGSRQAKISAKGIRHSGRSPSSRLCGYWVSETGDHSLYFGPIDPVAKAGTYLPILRSHEPRSWVRFAVVREEADGEEMVIREIDEQGNATASADTILRVPKEGGALVRVSMTQERPLLAVYYPIGHKRTHEAGVRPAP